MLRSLNVIMGECGTLDEVLELLREVTEAVMPGKAEAIEKASEAGAKIAVDIKRHQFLKHADVSEYNKLIAKAFPEQVEEKKKEKECDCSQKKKSDNKHKD